MYKRRTKTLAILAAIFFSLNLPGGIIFAQSNIANDQTPTDQTIKAVDYLPSNLDMVLEFSTVNANPFTQWLENLFKFSLNSDLSNADSMQFYSDVLKNNRLIYASKLTTSATNLLPGEESYYSAPDYYVGFYLNGENFKKMMVEADTNPKSETYNGVTLYTLNNVAFAARIKDLMVLTNNEENLKIVINNYKNNSRNTLAFNDSYQKVQNHTQQDNFFSMYFNPKALISEGTNSTSYREFLKEIGLSINENATSYLTGEGISISQIANGFTFSTTTTGDINRLRSNNLTLDKYNFTPSLYKNISGKDLIFYSEKTNLKAQLEDSLKMISLVGDIGEEYNNFKAALKTQAGIDFDNELMGLLTGKNMITVHNTGTLMPGITVAFDVQNKIPEANSLLIKFDSYIKSVFESLNKETVTTAYQTTVSPESGLSFYEYNIDLKKLNSAEIPGLDMIKIRTGITREGMLIITTLPNLNLLTNNGSGLTDNNELASAFTDREQQIAGIAYLNFNTLKKYIDKLMLTIGNEESDMMMIDNLLGTMKDVYIKSSATPDTAWTSGYLKMDIKVLNDLVENLLNTGYEYDNYIPPTEETFPPEDSTTPNSQEDLQNSTKPLCDVYTNDWYYNYVTSLQEQGIINGYKDGCFHPNQQITRAEFIKMLLCKCVTSHESNNHFSDVPKDAWYAGYINYAADHNIVKGFNDGTFHPNEPITRAEALQMVYNMFSHYDDENNSEPFSDVSQSDWFYQAVAYGYSNYIIDGNSTLSFEPNRLLSRAEAAKIIYGYLDAYYGTSSQEQTPDDVENAIQ